MLTLLWHVFSMYNSSEAFGQFGEYEYDALNHDDEDIYEDLCAFRRQQVCDDAWHVHMYLTKSCTFFLFYFLEDSFCHGGYHF